MSVLTIQMQGSSVQVNNGLLLSIKHFFPYFLAMNLCLCKELLFYVENFLYTNIAVLLHVLFALRLYYVCFL